MAILADAFMTGIGPIDTNLDWVDCSNFLALVLGDSRDLVGHIKMGEPGENTELEWIEDAPNAWYFQGAAATSTSVTISSPTTTAAIQGIVRNYSIIGPEDASYLLQVGAAITGATLSTAAYAETTFATAAAGTIFRVWGNPFADKDDASDDISQSRTRRYNWTQVFERGIQIQKTREGIAMKAVADELKHQTYLRTLEIKRDLHLALFGSRPLFSSSTATRDSQYRTMNGIYNYIRDYDFDGTAEDTMVTNASSNALTMARIDTACYNIYNAGGFDEGSDYILVCSPFQARQISKFDKELVRTTEDTRKAGHFVNMLMTDLGEELPVIKDRYCPKDSVMILDKNRLALRFLKGDQLHLEKMAKTGRAQKWQLSMQATIEMRNANTCHYLIHSLSTS